MRNIAVLLLNAGNLVVNTRTLTQTEEAVILSRLERARCSRGKTAFPPSSRTCADRRGDQAVSSAAQVFHLLAAFRSKHTALQQASPSSEFLAAHRVHTSPLWRAPSQRPCAQHKPNLRHAWRAPRGWWRCHCRRPARVYSQGSSEEAGPGPGETEAEGCARVDPPGLHRAQSRHRTWCCAGSAGPEPSYEYARSRKGGHCRDGAPTREPAGVGRAS